MHTEVKGNLEVAYRFKLWLSLATSGSRNLRSMWHDMPFTKNMFIIEVKAGKQEEDKACMFLSINVKHHVKSVEMVIFSLIFIFYP